MHLDRNIMLQSTKDKRYCISISNKKPWSIILWCTLSQNGPKSASRSVGLTWPQDCVNGDRPLGSWNNKGFYGGKKSFIHVIFPYDYQRKDPQEQFTLKSKSITMLRNTAIHHSNACSFNLGLVKSKRQDVRPVEYFLYPQNVENK